MSSRFHQGKQFLKSVVDVGRREGWIEQAVVHELIAHSLRIKLLLLLYADAPRAKLPITEDFAGRIINLPSSAHLKDLLQ